jgi:branched-chain amino acid transport system permease protein
MNRTIKLGLNILAILLFGAALYWANGSLDSFQLTILTLCGVNVVLTLSLNLINGFTGMFSLGSAGFMALGAYTMALLTMPPVSIVTK